MTNLNKKQLEKIWKQLDGMCEALERLSEYDNGNKLLDDFENKIDFSSVVMLKNEVEELIEKKSRKK
jgi:hypothetical protein